ncbi:hypothetical protein QTJ16_001439 [Diplocarpon rosae]|uniref:Class II aldolase/adducin N-terminal domain-containing protein n=1 Tax=Diplocarpon rosae TaxID=946125 RepID=A0AAD9WI51_9HELO|nr:hypothetical protein QTJ16_001439 [Diplocarpon rosae]
MAPPSATHSHETGSATLEPGLTKSQAATKEATMPKLEFPTPRNFEDKLEERAYQKGRLALAFRIFAKFGFDEGVAGHITLRVGFIPTGDHLVAHVRRMRAKPFNSWIFWGVQVAEVPRRGEVVGRDPLKPDHFWVNPFGVAWPLLRASDLILVNPDGQVVDGGPCRLLNTAGTDPPSPSLPASENSLTKPNKNTAYMIHHAVHVARPEVNCVAHSHSIHGRAFSTLGRALDITTQDACAFFDDLALYTSFRGVVLAAEEGQAIAAALGGKKAALLQSHGLLTCARTVEAAVFWFVSLEKCCRVQLLADAAAAGQGGKTVKIARAEAETTYQTVGTEMAGWFSAKPMFDVMESESGVDCKW